MAQAGPNKARQDAPHPHSTLIDPTGKFLLVPDLGADIIRVYSIDSSSGRLTSCSNFTTAPGVGPRHGAFWAPSSTNKRDINARRKRQASSGTMLFILNELVSSISSYTLAYPTNGSSGCLGLTLSQTASLYPAGRSPPTGSKAAEIRIHVSIDPVSCKFDFPRSSILNFDRAMESLRLIGAITRSAQISIQWPLYRCLRPAV